MSRNARTTRTTTLAIHREGLIQRADAERQLMAGQLQQIRLAAISMDRRIHAAQRTLSSPIVIGLAAGLLLIIGPRRGLRLIKRGAELWLMSRNWLPRIASLF
jgi:YqjK-like protein